MTVQDVIEQVKTFSPEELAELMRAILELQSTTKRDQDDSPWTDEELEELMTIEPLTGAEIVERGLTGTWADLDIEDGSTWVDKQRQKRRERRQW